MKNNKLYLILLTAVALSTVTSSCDKLKKALFVAFSANSATVEFNIPMFTDTTTQRDMGTINNTINLDSIIQAETKGEFSLSDIDKITVEEAKMTILNPDPQNNFANFENGRLMFQTDVKTTPVVINSGNNPDVYATEWTLPPIAGVNLKEYLTGTKLFYVLNAKARRATTKDLQCKLAVRFRIE